MDKLIGRLVAKLDELSLRENTLVIFLGDNGTGREITSQFSGQSYRGGKGLTNARGMHVPLIANWPGRIPAGQVNGDLIDSTDFLPTLCEAAGAQVPTSLPADGRSFLPQLLGQKGQPREWTYCWYAKDGGPTATAEFAMSVEHKLYRDGRFFELSTDPFEERPLQVDDLSAENSEAASALSLALDQYADARPAHLREPATRGSNAEPARKAARRLRRAARQRGDQNVPRSNGSPQLSETLAE